MTDHEFTWDPATYKVHTYTRMELMGACVARTPYVPTDSDEALSRDTAKLVVQPCEPCDFCGGPSNVHTRHAGDIWIHGCASCAFTELSPALPPEPLWLRVLRWMARL